MERRTTIFALSSARGRAGVCVFRLSGPAVASAIATLTRAALPPPRRAVLRDVLAVDGALIDRGLLLWFKAPASFTGEDVAEFHLHGGRAVIEATVARLAGLEGLRLAEPGEFARRAFANGKFDLTEAEGLADLVAAETEQQRRQALRQMQGGLKELYESWRARLLRALAHIEAAIDFADEDLPAGLVGEVRDAAEAVAREIAAHLADDRKGEIVRDGLRVVILGAPNVGKSSLLNALARRDVAIVSEIAGTTRDVIEVDLDLGGYVVTLIDTAGLRDSDDPIESEGVRRARDKARHADLRLAVIDGGIGETIDSRVSTQLESNDLVLVNKCDLMTERSLVHDGGKRFYVSAKTGEGIGELLAWLEAQLVERLGGSESSPITRARYREALDEAQAALAQAQNTLIAASPAIDLAAEDMRLAMRALGRITGRVDVEDLLDVIFRDFCIGK